jgi:hypothetical protein
MVHGRDDRNQPANGSNGYVLFHVRVLRLRSSGAQAKVTWQNPNVKSGELTASAKLLVRFNGKTYCA